MADRDLPEDEQSAFDLEQDFSTPAPVASRGSSSDPIAQALAEEAKKGRNFKLAIGGSLAGLALLGGSFFLTPLGGSHNVLKAPSATSTVSTQEDDSRGKQTASPAPTATVDPSDQLDDTFWQDPANAQPITLATWQKTPYTQLPVADAKKAIVAAFADSEMAQASSRLPSEATGYTSDDTKAKLADGTPNYNYSYWTAEEYQYETGLFLTRLVNPAFGEWTYLQYAANRPATSFRVEQWRDLFSDRFMATTEGKQVKEWMPLYADWDANNYGMGSKLLKSGPRWYGTITSTTSTFTYDQASRQYKATLKAQVKYTAWAKDQSKLEKTGTLTMTLAPNQGATASSWSHRKVVIDQITLKVN